MSEYHEEANARGFVRCERPHSVVYRSGNFVAYSYSGEPYKPTPPHRSLFAVAWCVVAMIALAAVAVVWWTL